MAHLTSLPTLVVDDEPLARRRLRRLLDAMPGVHVVGEYAHGDEVAGALGALQAALLVLDVEMPGLNGLDLLARLGPEPARAVIFVTAHEQYAVRAFDAHAVDYVLKPVRAGRLREAVRRAAERLSPRGAAPSRYLTRVPVVHGPRLVPVPVADIDWIEAAENYVALHCGAKSWLYRSPIGELEVALDPARFLRIHRSCIVNVERVAHVTPSPSGDCLVELTTGARVRLSRTYRSTLDRLLTGRQ